MYLDHLVCCMFTDELPSRPATKITIFTRISAAALIKFFTPQVRCLIEGGAYLKIGHGKEIFSFNLTVKLQYVTEASIHYHHPPLSVLFSGVFTQLRSHCPLLKHHFLKKKTLPVCF